MDKLKDLIPEHTRLFRGSPPTVFSHVPAGWYDLVDQLCTDIEAAVGPEPERLQVKQIKEKFGALRFYFSLDGYEDAFIDIHGNGGIRTLVRQANGPRVMEQIRALVSAASERSTTTCQECGAPGVRAPRGGWVTTLCERHATEQQTGDTP